MKKFEEALQRVEIGKPVILPIAGNDEAISFQISAVQQEKKHRGGTVVSTFAKSFLKTADNYACNDVFRDVLILVLVDDVNDELAVLISAWKVCKNVRLVIIVEEGDSIASFIEFVKSIEVV